MLPLYYHSNSKYTDWSYFAFDAAVVVVVVGGGGGSGVVGGGVFIAVFVVDVVWYSCCFVVFLMLELDWHWEII